MSRCRPATICVGHTLRSLARGWWLQLAMLGVLPMSFAVLGGSRFFAHNGTMVWVLCLAGWFTGMGVAGLGKWPNRVLTPGYARSLLATLIVVPASVALGWGVLSMLAGNRLPALGPGLLAGSACSLGFLVLGRNPFTLLIFALILVLPGPYFAFAARTGFHDSLYESLSEPWIQVSALGLAAAVLFLVNGRLKSPRFEPVALVGSNPVHPDSKMSGSGGVRLPAHGSHTRLIGRELLWGSPLVVFAVVLALFDNVASALGATSTITSISTFLGTLLFLAACVGIAFARTEPFLQNVHLVLLSDWLCGASDSRLGLGRWCGDWVLVRAVAWLPAGLAGAGVIALADMGPNPMFDAVLVLQLFVLLKIGVEFGFLRSVPMPAGRRNFTLGLAGAFIGGFLWILLWFDLPGPGMAALLLGCVGSAFFALWSARRALSKVEILV